jgi:hypothetical protein
MFLIHATDDLQRFLKLLADSNNQSWTYCAEERKSASFFLLRRNANLRLQKRNCALKFWTQLLIAIFMTGFGMVKPIKAGSYSVVVKSSAEKFDDLGSYLTKIRICWTKKYLIS